MKEIRLLKASEIECRVGQCGKASKGWCSILLYKDARCDQRILDEVFGIYGWTKSYAVINGGLFCTVSIRNPQTGEWVSKQDIGTESNTEAKKGEASDAFKRACFCIGIGRELYTAPKIFFTLEDNEMVQKNGKWAVSPKCVFTVSEIGYDKERNINALTIVDKDGKVRFKIGDIPSITEKETEASDEIAEMKAYAMPAVEQANDVAALERVWNDFPKLHKDSEFINAVTNRKSKIAA